MNTASLDLCRELYELSHWKGADYIWARTQPSKQFKLVNLNTSRTGDFNEYFYTYDLGYLLRKLPKCYPYKNTNYTNRIRLGLLDGKFWTVGYPVNDDFTVTYAGTADTPEDAACKLAIELFKRGILKKGGQDELQP